MIIRVSFLVVASVAAFKVSHIKTSPPAKKNSKIKSPGSNDLHYKFGERENSTANDNHAGEEEEETKTRMPRNQKNGEFEEFELLIRGDKQGNVTETELLQNLVNNYKQRQAVLERKVLELNGLKEEQSAIALLRRKLEEKKEKLDLLNKTITSLQAASKRLREKIREGVLAEKQLEIARKRIIEMQKKHYAHASPVKEQILMLHQQVTEFQKYDDSGRDATVKKKLKSVKEVELEVLELKRRNKELELEKREVGIKLSTALARTITEEKTMAKIREEITCLKHVNEELSEQVESLQGNRFDMVQELVYQRWLFTCLRFEALDHQKQSRKTSTHDCSQNSSKELYIKANASSTSDPELDSISSNVTLLESDENETTTTLESSSSSQSSSGSKHSLSPALIRRFSMSMVSADRSMPRSSGESGDGSVFNYVTQMQDCFKSMETQTYPRSKRVSFSDSVKPSIYNYKSEADEDGIDGKETRSSQSMEQSSRIRSCNKGRAK